jgi:Zn-dependent protease
MGIQQNLDAAVYTIPIVLLAFALHEMGHAWVATWFGDPTPAQHGRRTLNPIRHLDPVGTIMLVASMLLFGFPFGFAVTPVDDSKMRRPRLHGALTTLAGPFVNLLLCAIGALVLFWGLEQPDVSITLLNAAAWTVYLNAFLVVFNLLPIPPLDGGRIVGSLLKPELAREWNKLSEYGIFIIIGFALLGGGTFSTFLFELQGYLLTFVGWVIGHPELPSGFGL